MARAMRNLLFTSALLLITTSSTYAQRSESKILKQKNVPVAIEAYQAQFQRRAGTYQREGINHAIEYRNTSGRNITAIQFGLVSFDIWNEFLDRMGGVTMRTLKSNEKDKSEWTATAYADFSFNTGVAYVSKVRFDDGEIWSADLDEVAAQMRQIEKDFDVKNLKKKDEPNPQQ